MSRFAVLIESSQLAFHPDLPGARADVRLLRRWLRSPKGGAWDDHEIVTLSHPTLAEVKRQLEKARKCDYFFGAFSGHGHHVVNTTGGQTRVCLNDDEEMPARGLNPGNRRATVIIDACRGVTVELPRQLLENRVEKSIKLSMYDDRAAARKVFDRLVANCDEGAHYLFSCSIGQSAAEDENGQGGLFTLGLVRAGERWVPKPGYYSVRNAFNSAAGFTTGENPQQQPRCLSGDLDGSFPFAIRY